MSNDGNNPDFIGIGVPRSATTWLYTCLREHPDICVADQKEIEFFNTTRPFSKKKEPDNFSRGLSWYRSQFDRCSAKNIVGEFSVNYFSDPAAADRIHDTFPGVKLILILRNPIDRAWSHYQYQRAKQRDHGPSWQAQQLSFETFLETEEQFRQIGFYGAHLSRWLSLFPKTQMKVLLYEDIRENPESALQVVCDFLSVNDTFTPPSEHVRINQTWQKRRRNMENRYVAKIYAAFHTIKDTYMSFTSHEYTGMGHAVRKRVTELYRPHIKETEDILGRDLRMWY